MRGSSGVQEGFWLFQKVLTASQGHSRRFQGGFRFVSEDLKPLQKHFRIHWCFERIHGALGPYSKRPSNPVNTSELS